RTWPTPTRLCNKPNFPHAAYLSHVQKTEFAAHRGQPERMAAEPSSSWLLKCPARAQTPTSAERRCAVKRTFLHTHETPRQSGFSSAGPPLLQRSRGAAFFDRLGTSAALGGKNDLLKVLRLGHTIAVRREFR